MTLEKFFKENPAVALGFSGGVDSSYLLFSALRCGAKVQAYYVNAAFQPEFEMRDALRLANLIGADVEIITLDVLSDPTVSANPPDRCYHCKKVIFGTLKERALAGGYNVLIDGTNASDDADDRPGMRATAELSVRSPLRESGITKDEIRRLSKEAGLFTWDKPSYACLATRVPAGQPYTAELLEAVEKSEDALFSLGFSDFRARVLGGSEKNRVARLQFPQNQMALALQKKDEIIKAVKPYFPVVLLDLEGR